MKRQILIGKMIIVEPDYKIVHKKKLTKISEIKTRTKQFTKIKKDVQL